MSVYTYRVEMPGKETQGIPPFQMNIVIQCDGPVLASRIAAHIGHTKGMMLLGPLELKEEPVYKN
jgi:hypothetical protein